MAAPKPEIPSEEEIQSLSHKAQAAFAGRCTMRVFPLVGAEGHFDFWGSDAKIHLEGIWAAFIAATVAASNAVAIAVANAAFYAAITESSTESSTVSNAVSNSAYNAANVAFNASSTFSATSAAFNASSAAIKVDSAMQIIPLMREDFDFLLEHSKSSIDLDFLQRPLFSSHPIALEDWITPEIRNAFKSVGALDLLSMWEAFFHGKPPAKEEMIGWLENWHQEYKKREAKKESATEKAPNESQKTEQTAPPSKKEALPTLDKAKANPESTDTPEAEQVTGKAPLPPVTAHISGTATTAADSAAGVDKLNRQNLIQSLANMLSLEEQGTPITIGLFGHWGAGKSSVMKLLQKALSSKRSKGDDKRCEFLFGWFNAWEYENTNDIRAGLAQEVVNGLLSDGSYQEKNATYTQAVDWRKRWRIQCQFLWVEKRADSLKLTFKTLLAITPLVAAGFGMRTGNDLLDVGALGLVSYFGLQLFKQFKTLWDHPVATELATFFKLPSYKTELGQVPVIRKQLEGLCKIRLNSHQAHEAKDDEPSEWRYQTLKQQASAPTRRLIVFIDDLDRCKTNTIAETFDAIRLIANIPGVIVIVGIDERIAFKAMGKAYADYADNIQGRTKEDVARDYLGKIIQIPIRLNSPTAEGLKTFVQEKLFSQQTEKQSSGNERSTKPRKDTSGTESKHEGKPNNTPAPLPEKPSEPASVQNDKPPTPKHEERAPTPEQTAAELEKLQKEAQALTEAQQQAMEDTPQEVTAFVALGALFGFGNPRQLMRLRNTYRLLKALYPNKAPTKEPSDTTNDFHLMMMLFWLEFRLEAKEETMERWKLKVEKAAAAGIIEKQFHTEFYQKIDFNTPPYAFKEDTLKALSDLVETCLLPYPAKEVLQEAASTAAKE